MKLDAIVRAHAFMKTERPPRMWEADTEDVCVAPLLADMIAAGVAGGCPLEDLTFNVSNVVVQPPDPPDEEAEGHGPPQGEFVALTVSGAADLGPDASWRPGDPAAGGLLGRLSDRLATAGARFAYVRRIPPRGSITVFLQRKA